MTERFQEPRPVHNLRAPGAAPWVSEQPWAVFDGSQLSPLRHAYMTSEMAADDKAEQEKWQAFNPAEQTPPADPVLAEFEPRHQA